MTHIISHAWLSLSRVKEITENHERIELSEESREAIVKCRNYLDSKTDLVDSPLYGITTGFGSLYNVTIPKEDLSKL